MAESSTVSTRPRRSYRTRRTPVEGGCGRAGGHHEEADQNIPRRSPCRATCCHVRASEEGAEVVRGGTRRRHEEDGRWHGRWCETCCERSCAVADDETAGPLRETCCYSLRLPKPASLVVACGQRSARRLLPERAQAQAPGVLASQGGQACARQARTSVGGRA